MYSIAIKYLYTLGSDRPWILNSYPLFNIGISWNFSIEPRYQVRKSQPRFFPSMKALIFGMSYPIASTMPVVTNGNFCFYLGIGRKGLLSKKSMSPSSATSFCSAIMQLFDLMPKVFDNRYILKVLLFLAAGIAYNESFLSKKKQIPSTSRLFF